MKMYYIVLKLFTELSIMKICPSDGVRSVSSREPCRRPARPGCVSTAEWCSVYVSKGERGSARGGPQRLTKWSRGAAPSVFFLRVRGHLRRFFRLQQFCVNFVFSFEICEECVNNLTYISLMSEIHRNKL
jgi:hypothetical protein